jgi:hypothetical protein
MIFPTKFRFFLSMNLLITISIMVLCSTLYAAEKSKKPRFKKDIIKETFRFDASTKATVPLKDLMQGCPERDCIPAIDKPKFVSMKQASFLTPNDLVIVASYNNITKIYSRNMLESHEIVNDWFGSLPVAVTFCPLCGTAVAVVRMVDGQPTEFGVSGVLHNSDLVMYDRRTNSLWGQLTSRAIVGDKTGTQLRKISAQLMSWPQAQESYPQAKVLSTDTGYDYNYLKPNYQKYYDSDKVVFPVSSFDARANAKQVVYGISLEGKNIAFTQDFLEQNKSIDQPFNDVVIHIENKGNGNISAVNKESGEAVPITHSYWFAWYNFHPNTVLFGGKQVVK